MRPRQCQPTHCFFRRAHLVSWLSLEGQVPGYCCLNFQNQSYLACPAPLSAISDAPCPCLSNSADDGAEDKSCSPPPVAWVITASGRRSGVPQGGCRIAI